MSSQRRLELVLRMFPKQYRQDMGEDVVGTLQEKMADGSVGANRELVSLAFAGLGMRLRTGFPSWTREQAFGVGAVLWFGWMIGVRSLANLGGVDTNPGLALLAIGMLFYGLFQRSESLHAFFVGLSGVLLMGVALSSNDRVLEFVFYEFRWLVPTVILGYLGSRHLDRSRIGWLVGCSVVAATALSALLFWPGRYSDATYLVVSTPISTGLGVSVFLVLTLIVRGGGWLLVPAVASVWVTTVLSWVRFRGGLEGTIALLFVLLAWSALMGEWSLRRTSSPVLSFKDNSAT